MEHLSHGVGRLCRNFFRCSSTSCWRLTPGDFRFSALCEETPWKFGGDLCRSVMLFAHLLQRFLSAARLLWTSLCSSFISSSSSSFSSSNSSSSSTSSSMAYSGLVLSPAGVLSLLSEVFQQSMVSPDDQIECKSVQSLDKTTN